MPNDRKWTANKGEWSEAYVFLKLLGEGRVPLPQHRYQLINAFLRDEGEGSVTEYKVNRSTGEVEWVIEEEQFSLPQAEFLKESDRLLKEIKVNTGTFTVESTVEFYRGLGIHKLKPSTTKADLDIDLYDPVTGQESTYGWSVKSLIGSSPTLLNASGATRFEYELSNMTDAIMDKVNAIGSHTDPIKGKKYKRRIQYLIEQGHLTTSGKPIDPVFEHNLQMVDTELPSIIGELLKLYYSKDRVNSSRSLLSLLEADDPLKFGKDYSGIYTYKWRQFLVAVALGMEPNTWWDGDLDATGGFLVVDDSGQIEGASTNDRTNFEAYLLDSTKLDTPSGRRHHFGDVLKKDDGTFMIELGLQIRYTS